MKDNISKCGKEECNGPTCKKIGLCHMCFCATCIRAMNICPGNTIREDC